MAESADEPVAFDSTGERFGMGGGETGDSESGGVGRPVGRSLTSELSGSCKGAGGGGASCPSGPKMGPAIRALCKTRVSNGGRPESER